MPRNKLKGYSTEDKDHVNSISSEKVVESKKNITSDSKMIGNKRKSSDKETIENVKKFNTGFLNEINTNLESLSVICTKTTPDGKLPNFKIVSWNVAGIRAWVKKNGIDYIKKEQPDVMCIQEVKCSENKLPHEVNIKGYNIYWCLGLKEGYAGVGLYSKVKPLSVKYGLGMEEYDSEGRVITAEYEKFYIVATYVPNAGTGLKNLQKRMKWDIDFRNYLKSLDEEKPVILCGDMNVSHQSIDLANPNTNTKSPGFTQEERDGMTALLNESFIDSFRHLYPDKTGAYTYWTYLGRARSRNVGWRLDYFILSERFFKNVCDNVIRNEVFGSDHCPIVLFLSI